MKDKLYICDHAGTEHCKNCYHNNVHKKGFACMHSPCGELNIKVKCIPYKQEEEK